MKRLLAYLFPKTFELLVSYIYQLKGSAAYHDQYRGGIGAEITLKVPVTNSTEIYDFSMKGLLRVNPDTNLHEFHNGTSWIAIVDFNYGSTLYKPLSYVPAWSEIASKPSFFSGAYADLTGKPTLFSGNYNDLSNKPTLFSGSYLDLTNKPTIKRQETYSGTTIAAGTYTVTFATAYSVAPNIQANIINGTDSQNIRTTSITTTGFTVLVRNRVDVVGLLPSWNNVSGATVDVLITEK